MAIVILVYTCIINHRMDRLLYGSRDCAHTLIQFSCAYVRSGECSILVPLGARLQGKGYPIGYTLHQGRAYMNNIDHRDNDRNHIIMFKYNMRFSVIQFISGGGGAGGDDCGGVDWWSTSSIYMFAS